MHREVPARFGRECPCGAYLMAILDRDDPLIMALLLLTTVIILACNLVADILYALVDPRIRYE